MRYLIFLGVVAASAAVTWCVLWLCDRLGRAWKGLGPPPARGR
jgi:hypothetical protein